MGRGEVDAYHESCCQESILCQCQTKFSLQGTEALSMNNQHKLAAPTGSIKACLTTIPYAGRPSMLALSPLTPLLAMIPMKRHNIGMTRRYSGTCPATIKARVSLLVVPTSIYVYKHVHGTKQQKQPAGTQPGRHLAVPVRERSKPPQRDAAPSTQLSSQNTVFFTVADAARPC